MFKQIGQFLVVEKGWHQKALGVIYVLALALLTFFVITSPNKIIYDENFFYPNIAYLHKVGLSTFITTYVGQAPGPLYQFVHYITYVLSQNIFYVRLDNLLFAFLNILVLASIIKKSGTNNYLLAACVYITIPLSWANSGLALTETPTILFSLLFFYYLSHVLDKPKANVVNILILSLLLTASIIGRSTFLVQTFALFLFFIYKLSERRYFVIIVGVLALIIPFYIFYLWKGLMPPQQAYLSKGGLSFYHFILMLSYTGIMLFIMYPNSVRMIRKHYALYVIVLCLVFISLFKADILIPFQTVKFSHPEYLKFPVTLLYSVACSFFIIAAVITFFEERSNFFIIVFIFLALLLATSLKITHQFSARYAFQTMPFVLLVFRKYYKANWLQLITGIIGITMGVLSLRGYYLL